MVYEDANPNITRRTQPPQRLSVLCRAIGARLRLPGQQLTLTSSTPAGCNKADTSARPGGHRGAYSPSGVTPTPSPDDARLTLRLCAAADVLDLPLLDHLIVGDEHR